MRLGVDRLFQFPRQRKHQRARLRHRLERSGQQCAKLHRRRDNSRQSSTVAVGCRRLHGRPQSTVASALTYRAPATDPFSALDGALTTLCGANPTLPATCGLSTSSKNCPALTAYTAATPCTNNNVKTKGNTAVTLAPGVYFISGTLTLVGGSSITGTGVTFILLPGATIDTKGGGTLTLTGPTSAPSTSSLPAAFQSDAGLFKGMAMYDASTYGCAIRWKQQHQHHRKHLRADRGRDVSGRSASQFGGGDELWRTDRRIDRVQWQRHLRRQRVRGGGGPGA